MSNSNIISVGEMIDAAFGEEDHNVVNFKLIQAVLYLLARQLRILERRVKVEIEIDRGPSKTNLSVSEIKIRATVPKKRKRIARPGGVSEETGIGKQGFTTSKPKTIPEYQSTSEKSFEKSALDKSSTTKSSTQKSTSDKTKSSNEKSTSGETKSSTEKSTSDKSKTSDKTTLDETKSSSGKTTTDGTKTSTDKTTSDKTTSSTDKTTSDKITSSTDKTFSDKSKPSTDKTSSDKTSSDKTSDKLSSETTKSSTDKTSSEKTSMDKTSSDKTSSDRTKTSTDKTSTEKSSTDRTSSDKTKSSSSKSTTDKTTSSSKKNSSTKDTSSSGGQYKEKDLPNLLEIIEEQREKELRVIHQRADSREVTEKSPTPMASLDSVEEQYEKILVVERIPAQRKRSSTGGKRSPQLSIVTQDQFEALANVVRDLQSRFTPISTPGFPDNMKLMHDLRKGASLTDAMAALQLSARLEAAEKTLNQMLELVTDLASKSGLEIELKSQEMPDEKKALYEPTETSTSLTPKSKKSTPSKHSKLTSKSEVLPSPIDTVQMSMPSSEPSKIDIMPTPTSIPGPEEEKLIVPTEWITYDELDQAIQEVTDGLLKTLNSLTAQSNANAADAMKIARRLEEKLEASLNLGSRMGDLELLVSKFSEEVTVLDTGLSSQMTNYQEQLTQMQHDLEAGLESMAEALANTGGDTAAVAELNTHFTNLQTDVDIANTRQKELTESQNGLSKDLQELWQQIEMLRELKSDRDEVADALRDKAGLGDLNGLVSLQQFNAVRGDFEKRIGSAYDKFNNQEITWQKAIDDLLRELNDKADWDQLVALRDDINKILQMLRNRLNAMLEIVGEPRAAAVTRKLFRDDACLSCSSPAHMDLKETSTVPKMPAFPGPSSARPPTIGAENTSKPAEDGDHRACVPGLPIPHPIDPRAHICHRYCGGSHTLVTDKKSRTPIGMSVIPVMRRITTGIGSDGKTYKIEETMPTDKPCLPCNEKNLNTPQPSEAEPVKEKEEFDSDMTPSDFMSALGSANEQKDGSATPPPPTDEF